MSLVEVGWGVRGADRVCMGHWGVTYKMKMAYCKVLVKTQDSLLQTIEHELRSMRPKLVPLLATRCLYLGGIEEAYGDDGCGRVHLAKHHPDPQADDMLC